VGGFKETITEGMFESHIFRKMEFFLMNALPNFKTNKFNQKI
jgi:hypothetical protein